MTTLKMQRYQELWTHFVEFFPWLEEDFQKQPTDAVKFELYRYNTVERGSGYMCWCIGGVKREFWDKVVVPLIDELKDFRARWKRNKYNPEAFFVLLPSNRDEVAAFRTWVQTGQSVPDDTWDSIIEACWDADEWWDMEEDSTEYEENDFYKKRGW
jgi:hypothetical protein